jgi:predicted NBD/HSP70 family sugar kinase
MSDAYGDGLSGRTHEGQVVEALRRAAADQVAQPELIRETGLARGTVVNIVRRLKEKELVDTSIESRSSREGGRPAKVVSIRRDAGYALGVQFGHRHVRVSAGNLRGYQVFFRQKPVGSTNEASIDVGTDAQASLELAVDLVRAAIAKNASEGRGLEKLLAVTIGWPAPVQNWETGDVVIDNSMRQWFGIRRPADKLKEMLGLDVDVDFWTENDANLAALMELEHGVGHSHNDFVYVHWSSGIGGALVSGGKPQPGGARLAGELGHVPLPGAGAAPKPCQRCDSDHCLEVLAGGTAIVRQVTGTTNASLRDVITMAQGNGSHAEKAREELKRAAWLVGKALGPIVTFHNPTAIVIGGHFGRDPEEGAGSPEGARRENPRRQSNNPYDLIEATIRGSLQEHASPRALNSILEMNSSRWRYGTVQGGVAFATRKALDRYVNERAGVASLTTGRQKVI